MDAVVEFSYAITLGAESKRIFANPSERATGPLDQPQSVRTPTQVGVMMASSATATDERDAMKHAMPAKQSIIK